MKHQRLLPLFSLLLSLLLCSCPSTRTTLDFRSVQTKFNAASSADNIAPEGGGTGSSAYKEVASALTDSYIKALASELRATAWMMRGVSEWRLGQLQQANTSSVNGLGIGPKPHTRDDIMLTMLPGLVIDSDIVSQWKAAGKVYNSTQYAEVERQYVTAFKRLDAAQNAFGAATDASVKNYHAYHKWRMLYNWQTIINKLVGGPSAVNAAIESATSHFGGRDLLDVADAARDTIPAGDPLRELISAKTGR